MITAKKEKTIIEEIRRAKEVKLMRSLKNRQLAVFYT
jgi:hypothetical protein